MLVQLVRLSLQTRQHAEDLIDLAQSLPRPLECRSYSHFHSTGGETEAQCGPVTCSAPHRCLMVELGFAPLQPECRQNPGSSFTSTLNHFKGIGYG